MRVQSLIVVVLLIVGAIFALLNQAAVFEPRGVRFPGVVAERPLVLDVLVVAATGLVLVLAVGGWAAIVQARARRRLEAELAMREAELVTMKSRAYDRLPEAFEAFRRELTDRLAAVATQVAGLGAVGDASSEIRTARGNDTRVATPPAAAA